VIRHFTASGIVLSDDDQVLLVELPALIEKAAEYARAVRG
jgi:hypothetical protein